MSTHRVILENASIRVQKDEYQVDGEEQAIGPGEFMAHAAKEAELVATKRATLRIHLVFPDDVTNPETRQPTRAQVRLVLSLRGGLGTMIVGEGHGPHPRVLLDAVNALLEAYCPGDPMRVRIEPQNEMEYDQPVDIAVAEPQDLVALVHDLDNRNRCIAEFEVA